MKTIKNLTIIVVVLIMSLVLSACNLTTTKTPTLKISLNSGVDTVEIFSTFKDGGATAKYGDELVAVKTKSDVDTSKIGTYTVKYEATYNNKTVSIERKVTVVDETEPNLVLNPGVDTVRQGEEWTDAGVTAMDNSMTDVTIVVEGSVDVNTIGEYIITYYGTDASGNTTSIKRYVNVVSR